MSALCSPIELLSFLNSEKGSWNYFTDILGKEAEDVFMVLEPVMIQALIFILAYSKASLSYWIYIYIYTYIFTYSTYDSQEIPVKLYSEDQKFKIFLSYIVCLGPALSHMRGETQRDRDA